MTPSVTSSAFSKLILVYSLELSTEVTAALAFACSLLGCKQTYFVFVGRGEKWVRLFWHFRHGVWVLLQALVSMEMKNSVCHACSWIEFHTLGGTEAAGKPGSERVGRMEAPAAAVVVKGAFSLAGVRKGLCPRPALSPSFTSLDQECSGRVTEVLLFCIWPQNVHGPCPYVSQSVNNFMNN